MTTDTPFVVYSAAKAITATVVHLLVERGDVELDAPVAEYITGYERHGKGDVTVAHVLAHRAGVPNLPPDAFDLDRSATGSSWSSCSATRIRPARRARSSPTTRSRAGSSSARSCAAQPAATSGRS